MGRFCRLAFFILSLFLLMASSHWDSPLEPMQRVSPAESMKYCRTHLNQEQKARRVEWAKTCLPEQSKEIEDNWRQGGAYPVVADACKRLVSEDSQCGESGELHIVLYCSSPSAPCA